MAFLKAVDQVSRQRDEDLGGCFILNAPVVQVMIGVVAIRLEIEEIAANILDDCVAGSFEMQANIRVSTAAFQHSDAGFFNELPGEMVRGIVGTADRRAESRRMAIVRIVQQPQPS